MKSFIMSALGCLFCILIVAAGCCTHCGYGGPFEKYEKKVNLTEPLADNSLFAATTHNGSITINGTETADCNVTATIVARAGSKEDAMKLADETIVTLMPAGNTLTVKIDKPTLIDNQSIGVSLDGQVPRQTMLKLVSHNGSINVTNIAGKIEGKTHNGKISCKDVNGDAQLSTHNGKINVSYSQDAGADHNVSIVTHNGGIDLTTAPDLSAMIEMSTHNGSIHTDLPISVVGKISLHKVSGTIGQGRNKINLTTHNGSISIK